MSETCLIKNKCPTFLKSVSETIVVLLKKVHGDVCIYITLHQQHINHFMFFLDIVNIDAAPVRRDVLSKENAFDGNIGTAYSAHDFEPVENPWISGEFMDTVMLAGAVYTSRQDAGYGCGYSAEASVVSDSIASPV